MVEIAENVRLFAGDSTWIEGSAIEQLKNVAARPGMRRCVGMPDLHPGKGSPIGSAFLADRIFGDLVGTDDGCGMSLWAIDMVQNRYNAEFLVPKLDGLDQPWDGDTTKWLEKYGVEPTSFDSTLGTPGLGNHFIEIQRLGSVYNVDRMKELGGLPDSLYMMIHSGSRGLGESILYNYAAKHGANGVAADSPDGVEYLRQSKHAMAWAEANRQLCAYRTLVAIGTDGQQLLDICHNSVTEAIVDGCACWLHRKGAAPADKGPVVIPGSRGDESYLVDPVLGKDDALWSLAHGAGRKISRGDAQAKIGNLYRNKDIRDNGWGGRVICGDKALLMEEAPQCYKNIKRVIADLVEAGLITVIAKLVPVVTFKTSEKFEKEVRQDRKNWKMERRQARRDKRDRQ